jgi:hypothetical protein
MAVATADIRSPRQSSRARTKSRAASCSMLGIVTATISPRCSNRAKCRASRASVLTRCRSLRIRRSSGRPGSSELFAGSCREGPSECVLHDCGDVAQLVADGPVAVVDRMVGVERWAVKPGVRSSAGPCGCRGGALDERSDSLLRRFCCGWACVRRRPDFSGDPRRGPHRNHSQPEPFHAFEIAVNCL